MTVYAGFEGKIEMAYNTSTLLGSASAELLTNVQSLSIKTEHGTELVHAMGSRSGVALKEGNIVVTVAIERYWDAANVYGVPFSTLCGANNTSGQGALTTLNLGYYPGGATAAQPKHLVTSLKPKGYEVNTTQDGQLMEKGEFVGIYSSVGTLS